MTKLLVVHPPGHAPERAYAAQVVLGEWLGLEHAVEEGAVERWELRLDGRTVSVPDVFFRAPAAVPPDPDDVFGTVFSLITRYEETVVAARDEHDRFPAEATLTDLDRPLADEATERLWTQLAQTWRLERRPRSSRIVPTHDVDTPRSIRRLRTAAGELRRGRPLLAAKRFGALVGLDPVDTLDLLMESSERRGLRATFFFLADDAPYSLDEDWVRRLLRRVRERGHRIGLHPSYETFRDPEKITGELARLQETCAREGIEQDEWGARQHFLRWENPTTWRAYEEAGLTYDASLGFSARPGFRAGTCHEYPVFDLKARRVLRLRERPLVLMDTPTLDRVGLPERELVALIGRLRDECRRHGGDFTVLWHNHWLVTRRQRRLLEAALGPADR